MEQNENVEEGVVKGKERDWDLDETRADTNSSFNTSVSAFSEGGGRRIDFNQYDNRSESSVDEENNSWQSFTSEVIRNIGPGLAVCFADTDGPCLVTA